MIDLEGIRGLYGEDITLLFKGQEPFVEIRKGIPAGVLVENKDGKIICYLCNEWFDNLGPHLRSHKITNNKYREDFGFDRKTALCSRRFSNILSEKGRLSFIEDAGDRIRTMSKLRRKIKGRPKGSEERSQSKNRRNTCEEQIKARMDLLMNKFGNEISLRKVRKVDSGLAQYAYRHHGSWNNFVKQSGLEPNLTSKKKNRADLIYDLREYVSTYESSPWANGHDENGIRFTENKLNGFPHSVQPYLREFGSRRKLWQFCGIVKESGNERRLLY